MAIATQWVVAGTAVTSSQTIYTTAAATVSSYLRDLVVTNAGPSTLFVGFGAAAATATTVASFSIPAGGSVVLTQCQVPNATALVGVSAGTSATYVGYATNVAYI